MHNVVSLEERNGRCFDGEKQDLTKLKFLLLKTLYEWTSASSQFPMKII